jgi:PBSX family phage terminase large subunit
METKKKKIIKVDLKTKLLPAFKEFWMNSDKYLIKVLKGGRNSSKSTHISIKIIRDICKYSVNALVVRKVGNTLEESVYEQLMWAIDYLHVNHLFECKKSPLRIIYKPRGNRIIFRGADDPAKIKSLKTSKFPIAILWVEELAEFKTEEEIEVILNSVLRAELQDNLKYSVYYSYNPPKRKQNWCNKKFNSKFIGKNTYVHHSDYRCNFYCSQAFLDEVENVKQRNFPKYEWIYLGKPIGGGIVPFNNLTFKKIYDDEIERFDNIRQGIDWGYANDPLCFLRMHYDKKKRRLYIFYEIYGIQMSNRELFEKIIKLGYGKERIIADSAEPKSISEGKEYGLYISGAKKGAGSVEYGEKWLDDLEEIIIDSARCPNTTREFENIDYQTDRDGNIKNKLEDKDNHSIDTTRYAMSEDMTEIEAIIF